jgi:ribosomal protein L3 glutamine methyltransferase
MTIPHMNPKTQPLPLTPGTEIPDPGAIDHLETGQDWIRYTASCLAGADLAYGQGTDDALEEAERLVFAVLHWDPDWPSGHLSGRLLPGERRAIATLIARRIREQRPLAYLVREAYFFGLRLHVDERVLIPRSPIGELLDQHFEPWIQSHEVHRILDFGTGSGALAVGCALAFPDAEVDAIDRSPAALEVAAINRDRYGLGPRMRLLCSDGFQALAGCRYDLIVANPPYVDPRGLEDLPPEFTCEPPSALAAGPHGLDVIETLLAGATAHLAPQGTLVLEVGGALWALEERWPEIGWSWPELASGRRDVLVVTRPVLEAAGF